MKKLLRFADAIILICGTVGMLLLLWVLVPGPDEKGLYPAAHPGWILSWVLTGAVVIFIWLLTRRVGNNRSYSANFPRSVVGAIGYAAAAVAIAVCSVQRLLHSTILLDTLSGLVGILSCVGFLVAAAFRFLGKKPHFMCFLLPCVFFALHVFYLGRDLGGEPEAVRYLFRFLATLSLIPACYQLWGFCVGAGERQTSLFWSLLSGYLCILGAPGDQGGIMYLALGFWLLSNTCALKYLPRRSRPVPQPEETVDAQPAEEIASIPEIPCTMDEDLLSQPEPTAEATDVPLAEPETDPDAILAEILREIDSNVP